MVWLSPPGHFFPAESPLVRLITYVISITYWGHCTPVTYTSWGWYNRQTYNIRRTLVGNKIVDHSDVVGTSPVSAAPTTSSFSTKHLASIDWTKISICKTRRETFQCWDLVRLILEVWRYVTSQLLGTCIKASWINPMRVLSSFLSSVQGITEYDSFDTLCISNAEFWHFFCYGPSDKIVHILRTFEVLTLWICVNIVSGNGLLPGGTKPLPEPMLTYRQWDSLAFT